MSEIIKINGYIIRDEQARQDLTKKADKVNTYTKEETSNLVDEKIVGKADKVNTYTKEETNTKIIEEISKAQLQGSNVDLSNYATKEEIPTRVSQLTNDSGFLKEHQDISHKADINDVYTQIQTDNKISEAISKIELKEGPPGPKGEQGEVGPQGPKGDKGADGVTTSIVVNGNTYTHVDGVITLPNYPTSVTGGSNNAIDILIEDAGNNFVAENVEDALSEVSSQIKDIETRIDNLGGSGGSSGGEVDLSGYVTKEVGNASQITFADGQTFQSKLDNGTFKGEKGDKGDKGDPGDAGKRQEYLTASEYSALSEAEKNSEDVVYNITDIAQGGVILVSPGGNRFVLTVNDTGILSTMDITYANTIVASSYTVSVKQGQSVTFTISLENEPEEDRVVNIATNDSDLVISPNTLTFNASNYSTGQEITLSISEDAKYFSTKNAIITLSSTDCRSKTIEVNMMAGQPAATNYIYNSSTYTDPTSGNSVVKATYWDKADFENSVSNGVLTLVSDGKGIKSLLCKHGFGDGNTYYVRFKVKCTAKFAAGHTQDAINYNPTDDWILVSYVYTDTSAYQRQAKFAMNNVAGTAQLCEFMKINLTEVFGAGNEPTKDTCDEVFVNYVEGLVG